MSKPYEKECIFCKDKIRMSDEKGKWLPYNLNGTEHECKKKEQAKQDNGTNGNHSEVGLELVLKKLKSIGVTIDLDVLRNSVNGNTK